MHQQVPFNGDHSVSGQHLNEINGLSDDCSQQVGINSQQDQHRVIGNNFESDRPMSDCESEEDTDGNEQALQVVRQQPAIRKPHKQAPVDASESDDNVDMDSVHHLRTGYRINLSRRKNRYTPPVSNASKLWKYATSAQNPQRIRAVIGNNDQVTDEMRELVARRLAMPTAIPIPLEDDDMNVWEGFVDIYTSC